MPSAPAGRPRPAISTGLRKKAALQVALVSRQRRRRIDERRLTAALAGAARILGVSGEVALVLAGDRALRTLNRDYRGKDRPTDVLSFPGPCGEHALVEAQRAIPLCAACRGGEATLGDIVISVDTAERNARALARTLPEELDVLALHGFLHVLGFDHEADDGTMERMEAQLRERLLKPARRAAAGRRR